VYLPPAEWTKAQSWAMMTIKEASVIHMTAIALTWALYILLALSRPKVSCLTSANYLAFFCIYANRHTHAHL